jgi:16S rRNA (adenine(1408)-N(1))-methyltransferase
VLARATAEPEALALGIDANATGMAPAASRAARRPAKGGAPNARFLVSSVEALPDELTATADLVSVQFPWGSLLRGIVRGEPAIIEPIARLLNREPNAELRMLLSVEPRDRSPGLQALDPEALAAIATSFAKLGLKSTELRAVTPDELARSHSTWAKRLRAGTGERQAALLAFGVHDGERRHARTDDQGGRRTIVRTS